MVQLDRPSLTDYIFTGESSTIRTSSMRFKHIEPHRTFSNDFLTELARSRDSFHKRSEWFDCTEPSPPTSLPGIQGVQGARGTRSIFLHVFGVVRLDGTFSNGISSRDTRCAGCNMHQAGEVQVPRTSRNLLYRPRHRASKVSRLV